VLAVGWGVVVFVQPVWGSQPRAEGLTPDGPQHRPPQPSGSPYPREIIGAVSAVTMDLGTCPAELPQPAPGWPRFLGGPVPTAMYIKTLCAHALAASNQIYFGSSP
jgi:hypothetical protein